MLQLSSFTVFTPWQAAVLLALQGGALAIWWRQNHRPAARGGPIAMTKACWLVYAITLWLVAPLMLAGNAWRDQDRWLLAAMGLLAASLAIRGLVELAMLRRGTWRVAHGLGHDRWHLGLCTLAGALCGYGGASLGTWLVLGLTVIAMISELHFVAAFANATAGPAAGIYFVPNETRHHALLRRCATIFLPQYAIFLALLLVCLNPG